MWQPPTEKGPFHQKATAHTGTADYPLKPGGGLPAHQQDRKRRHLHERPPVCEGGGGDPHQLPAPQRQGTEEHHLFLCFLFKDKPGKTPVQGADPPRGYRAPHGDGAPGDGPGDQRTVPADAGGLPAVHPADLFPRGGHAPVLPGL